VRAFDRQLSQADIIILDLVMPDMEVWKPAEGSGIQPRPNPGDFTIDQPMTVANAPMPAATII